MELVDNEGFVVSFSSAEEAAYTDFFRKHGFVVIRDVLQESDISNTLDEIWTHRNLLGRSGAIKRDDPSTWSNNNWPTAMNIAERGFISCDYDYNLQESWNNRQNPNVYKPFANVLGTPNLWVKVDRYGMMRPTRIVALQDGSFVDKPEWITKSNWLHWDQNPWKEPDFVGVQGLVTLTESTQTSGGFHCVPDFHHQFRDWASKNEPKNGGIVNVPLDDPIRQKILKITMRARSLVIWDSRLPHGNYPNESSSFRIVQYITYFPALQGEQGEKERLKRLEPFVAGEDSLDNLNSKNFFTKGKSSAAELKYDFPELTRLGKKLLGIDIW